MNFDTVLLSGVIDEISRAILGARIDKITQPDPMEIVLGTYKDGARRNLLISAEPNSARLHFQSSRSRPSPANAPAFCMLLRKYIEAGTIEEISQPLGFCERVVKIRVRSQSRERTNLWIELMGRQSNIILVSEAGIILGSIKRVTSEMSRFREIRTGILYTPPPKQLGHKRDPMEPSSAHALPAALFANQDEAEKWLTSTFRGVGSLLAKEAVLRAPAERLTGETAWYGLNEILNIVRLAEYTPTACKDENGQVTMAYPIPLKSVTNSQQIPVDNLSAAVEAAFSSELEDNTFDKERTSLLSALRKAMKAAEKQLLDVREGLLSSERAESLKESGELLLANIGQGEAGSEVVSVNDYFAEDPFSKRSIALDASLSILENAERYFRRYQKARDSKDILLRRQSELEETISNLTATLTKADTAATLPEISALKKALTGEIPQRPTAGARETPSKPLFDGHKIKTIKSPDGWEILVGENSSSNDFLTTKVASPSDIWLHARAVPSAHAVIRAQNRPASVSTAAILLAAEQVAKRSQAKHAGLVSVDYTLKKYVRKPRGSAPGQVTYTNEKTIDVIADGD